MWSEHHGKKYIKEVTMKISIKNDRKRPRHLDEELSEVEMPGQDLLHFKQFSGFC